MVSNKSQWVSLIGWNSIRWEWILWRHTLYWMKLFYTNSDKGSQVFGGPCSDSLVKVLFINHSTLRSSKLGQESGHLIHFKWFGYLEDWWHLSDQRTRKARRWKAPLRFSWRNHTRSCSCENTTLWIFKLSELLAMTETFFIKKECRRACGSRQITIETFWNNLGDL